MKRFWKLKERYVIEGKSRYLRREGNRRHLME